MTKEKKQSGSINLSNNKKFPPHLARGNCPWFYPYRVNGCGTHHWYISRRGITSI